MKKTLQDQYLLIKEGKGHKGVFLTEAKRQFPDIVRNAATFEEAAASLKTKNIIAENIVGLTAVNSPFNPKKKESFETAFENFLAEAKKENEDEKVKAEEKKVSKPVEKDLEKNFDYSDEKNPDNMIFDQIMMGYYAEMKDPKNADKTMQQLKDIVFKNLAKDQIYYTKDGQFGVKDLGYSVDHPGLGEPKEAKGKYKSSGYGDLNESIGRNYPGELEGEYEGTLQKTYGVDIYDTLKDVLDISNSEDDFINKMTMSLTDETNTLPESSEEKLRIWYRNNTLNLEENKDLEREARVMLNRISGISPTILKDYTKEELKDALKKASKERFGKEKLDKLADQLEETKLRKVIREMIDAELEEAGRGFATMGTINVKGESGGIFIPKYYILPPIARKKLNLLNPGENAPSYNESMRIPHIKVLPDNTILYSNYLVNALDNPSDNRNPLNGILRNLESNFYWSQFKTYTKKFISSSTVKYPVLGREAVYHVLEFPNDFEVAKLKDWAEKELAKQYAKLQKAESGVVGRGRPVNIESLKKFIANLESLNQNPEGGMVVVLPQMFEESFNAESLQESVEKDLMDINKEAEHEVLQAKLDKIDALIDHRRSKLGKLDEDEDMKALTDKKKVKELEKDIKKLEVARNKVEKMMSKFKGKKSSDKKVIDEDEPIAEDLDVNAEYVEDSTERLDAGQKVDSIRDTYSNMGIDQKSDLTDYLNTIAPDDLKSDYVY
jgi:hypothetical protein